MEHGTRACVVCQESFPVNPGERNPRRYCSNRCMRTRYSSRLTDAQRKQQAENRSAYRKAVIRKRRPPLRRPCGHCGALYEPSRRDQKFCLDRTCRNARNWAYRLAKDPDVRRRESALRNGKELRPRVVEFNCAWCEKHHIVGRTCAPHASKFCPGPECGAAWHGHDGRSKREAAQRRRERLAEKASRDRGQGLTFACGTCPRCEASFVVPPWQVFGSFCSKACRNKAKGKGRCSRRKSLPKAIRTAIFERDDWTCQLCHLPIDPDEPLGNFSASIDHIIPVANGGTDDVANLQAAHRWCNSVRRDRSVDAAF